MTATVTEYEHSVTEDVRTSDGSGPATHIVNIPIELHGKISPQAYVMEARVEGKEIEALCGHKWIPQRDPKQYPVCTKCLDIYKSDPHGAGDRDRMPDA